MGSDPRIVGSLGIHTEIALQPRGTVLQHVDGVPRLRHLMKGTTARTTSSPSDCAICGTNTARCRPEPNMATGEAPPPRPGVQPAGPRTTCSTMRSSTTDGNVDFCEQDGQDTNRPAADGGEHARRTPTARHRRSPNHAGLNPSRGLYLETLQVALSTREMSLSRPPQAPRDDHARRCRITHPSDAH